MKKQNVFILVILAFLAGKFITTDTFSGIVGKTREVKVDGLTTITYYGSDVALSGVDERKKVFDILIYKPFREISETYKDVPKDKSQYLTWKENNLWSWNYILHLHEQD